MLAIGVLAALFFWGSDEETAPPAPERTEPAVAAQRERPPAAAEVAGADVRAATEDAKAASPEAARELRNTVFGTVELRAVTRPDGSTEDVPVESFRWKATGTAIGIEPKGISDGRVARIRVPVDVDAAVLVDADGCRTSLPVDIALRGTQFRAVTVTMRPQFETARITLRCKDEFGAPVDRVSVRCEFQPMDAESRREWQRIWTREVESRNGVHVLELPVTGWCRFHVTPIGKDGLSRAFLPAQVEVKIGDDRRVEEDLTHPSGGTLMATWNDAVEKPRGLSGARLQLADAEGRQRGVNWNKGPSPASVAQFDANDMAPSIDYWALPCYAAEALPEGRYSVRLQGEDLDMTKRVEVRKGQEARVVFP